MSDLDFKKLKSPYPIVDEYICINRRDFNEQLEKIQDGLAELLDNKVGDDVIIDIRQLVINRFAILEHKTE